MEEGMNKENTEELMQVEENTKELKQLEDKIRRLEEEVAELKRQRQIYQPDLHASQTMRDAMSLLCGKMPQGGAQMVLSNLREEVKHLQVDLRRQSRMNGISLRSCSVETLQGDGTELVQKMCVSGCCSEFDFLVALQLSQVETGERPEKKIVSLDVVLGDIDLPNFSSFLSGVEESKDLLLFFRTLRTLSDRINDRRRTFQHFQAKYPQVVSLPDGDSSSTLALHHPALKRCTFLLHWCVDVSKEGKVTPKLDLLPKIPQQALRLLPSWNVDGVGEGFHSLLRLLGPEAALEEVIRAALILDD
ncbi:centromere protein P isoform X2 [Corythoichthys intestinalis]|nr:centromere protein P isoform X2 [Corythoichthys intestinalis]XP_061814192.1 centromere protein P-like [Nerophis lumbriciformis]